MRLEPFTLDGRHVRLVPLGHHLVPELVDAGNADRSSFGYTPVPETIDSMHAYVATLLADAQRDAAVPFAQTDARTGRVLGCTRFLNVVWWPGRDDSPAEVEIGGTWLTAGAQRSPINSEAKLLLLGHAFDVWEVHRVAICTDARNERSRAAIERLGAQFEGILRRHRASTGHATEPGTARDTAAYSIIPEEWPDIRERLEQRLGFPDEDGR
jgi:N-acetyltransferase